MRNRIMALGLGAAAAVSLALAFGLPSGAGASQLGHRPAAAQTITAGFNGFTDTFTKGTGNFCDNKADAKCDGNPAGDYGTVNRVGAGFNNGGYGNYAQPGGANKLPNGTGTLSNHVILDGTSAANQGNACPTAGTEGCTGPYAESVTGGQNSQTGFPDNGYTLTVYQYVDTSYTSATGTANGAGSQFDTDMGISKVDNTTTPPTASYGADEIITTCNNGDGTASLAFGHGSPGTCATNSDIPSSGWYRYVFLVSQNGGHVFLDARVLNAAGTTTVFDSGSVPVDFGSGQVTTAETGGLRYLWWPTLNVDGLSVGYINYSAGQLQSGHNS